MEAQKYTNDALFDGLEDENVRNDAMGMLQNSAPDIDTAEKRMAMLKDLIIKVMERKCELYASSGDPEKELESFNLRLEIDRLKSGKLRMSDEEDQ